MVKVKRMLSEGKGKNAKLVGTVKTIRGMVHADDAGIVSQSPRSSRDGAVYHRARGRVVWTVGSEPRDGDHVMPAGGVNGVLVQINAARVMFNHTDKFVIAGGKNLRGWQHRGQDQPRVQRAHDYFRRNS